MANYLLKRKNIPLKVNKMTRKDGYILKPNIKNKKMISITKLSIESKDCTNNLLTKKITKNFRKIMSLYIVALDDDTSSGNCEIALNEIEKLKSLINYEYEKYLDEKLVSKYLKRLSLFEKNLRDKIRMLKFQEELVIKEGKSR